MTKSNKTYIVRCPRCKHRVFDANYADVQIKCPLCKKIFEVKAGEGGVKIE
jgi:phage FluMu protein Com